MPTPTLLFGQRGFDSEVSLAPIAGSIPFGVLGTIGFLVQNNRFVVAELSSPGQPRSLWQSRRFTSDVGGVTLENGLAYLREDDQLLIWDVSDPLAPIEVGQHALDGAFHTFVEDRTIYHLAWAEAGITVITVDAAIPSTPVEVSRVTLSWPDFVPYHIAYTRDYFLAHGGRIFMIGEERISVYDLSQPSGAPLIIDLPTSVSSHLAADDGYLYVTTDRGLFIYDLTTDPPTLIIEQYPYGTSSEIHTLGAWVFLWNHLCGWEESDDGEVSGGCGYVIEVVDFTDLADPILFKRISLELDGDPWVEWTALHGSRLYLYTAGYSYVFDLSPYLTPAP